MVETTIALLAASSPAAAASTAGVAAGAGAAAGAVAAGAAAPTLATLGTMAGAALSANAFGLLSGGFSVISGLTQANAQQQNAAIQAQAYQQQAWQSTFSSNQEAIRGQQEANALRQKMLQTLASNRAAAGASGITLESGSVQSVQDAVTAQGNRQLDVSRANARLSQLSGIIGAESANAAAYGAINAGKTASRSTLFETAASVLKRS